ncbi:MAG: spore coat protein CotH, partial [Bacteroidetes bacterium]|nr:spore coat protein CotH [Bacteroidota bacterium]
MLKEVTSWPEIVIPGRINHSGRIVSILLLLFITCSRLNSQDADQLNLPLVVIDTWGQAINDDPKINAWLKVIDNGPGKMNDQLQQGTDYDGNMGIEIRGQSSQMFPKKSYTLEL